MKPLAWPYTFALTFGIASSVAHAAGMGTAFTYQGHLENPPGIPVDGVACDFRFGLWDAAEGWNQKGDSPQTETAVDVVVGVFTVGFLDFGPGAFDGTARWLEIEVQCPGDAGFVLLEPRQELTPAPYSLRAGDGVGGPNALNVTSAGNVGIGTAAPAAQLDVNGTTRTTKLEITGGVPGFPSPLVGWGSNAYGQTDVPAGKFIKVAAGGAHSVAIRWDGTLAAWGNNDFGQTDVPPGTFQAIAAGAAHSLAIRTDDTLVGWGSNSAGQIDVPPGPYFAIAAAEDYSLAIRYDDDTTIVAWGDFPGPVPVPPFGEYFWQIAAGTSHCLATKSIGFDNVVVGWGSNSYGETTIPAGTSHDVAAGNGYSVARRTDGTLVAWGLNDVGQTDVPAGALGQFAAGWDHGLAIRSGGTLAAWGHDDQGQLDVPDGTFAAIAAGRQHSLGIQNGLPPSDPALLLHTDSAFKPGANNWTMWSDRRLKKNIEPLSGALDHLLQLHGVTFEWRDPASQGGITGTQMGLIADEVAQVFPQWIGRDAKGYQTLTVGGFEALTTEALRELRAEKDRQLKDKDQEITELEARLSRLEALLEVPMGTAPGQLRPAGYIQPTTR